MTRTLTMVVPSSIGVPFSVARSPPPVGSRCPSLSGVGQTDLAPDEGHK